MKKVMSYLRRLKRETVAFLKAMLSMNGVVMLLLIIANCYIGQLEKGNVRIILILYSLILLYLVLPIDAIKEAGRCED